MNKFSSSPELHLQTGSPLHSAFEMACWAVAFLLAALVLLAVNSQPGVAVVIALCLAANLYCYRHGERVLALAWSGGQWRLRVAGRWVPAEPLESCASLGSLHYLVFATPDRGTTFRFWLVPGGGTGEQVRRLRVRLRLEGVL